MFCRHSWVLKITFSIFKENKCKTDYGEVHLWLLKVQSISEQTEKSKRVTFWEGLPLSEVKIVFLVGIALVRHKSLHLS